MLYVKEVWLFIIILERKNVCWFDRLNELIYRITEPVPKAIVGKYWQTVSAPSYAILCSYH